MQSPERFSIPQPDGSPVASRNACCCFTFEGFEIRDPWDAQSIIHEYVAERLIAEKWTEHRLDISAINFSGYGSCFLRGGNACANCNHR